ncbi:ParA family protein [Xanthovirga aplysinae]|uniref:ParA family protein n=1 Tax=Xanthovirga aplysinae TaxID=2529853 RepID=UPI001FEA8B3F|nr:AAA family ATPase [Xanthovirga aplysinae]
MLTNEVVINFLSKNPALSLTALEKEAGISIGLLSKVIRQERKLNDNHLRRLKPILEKYGLRRVIPGKDIKKTKIISVVNHKGGVGKTTTVINLGKALSLQGFRVLLIDLDSQGNLSQSLGVDEPEDQVVDALLKEKPLPILSISDKFDLSPSDLALADADIELIQSIAGFNRLKRVLTPVKNQYDYILIDCPPSLNIITSCAMVASNACLITLQPEISALKGLDKILSRIEEIREEINDELILRVLCLPWLVSTK